MSSLATIPGELRCAVCRQDRARRREDGSGTFYGNACDGECHELLKEMGALGGRLVGLAVVTPPAGDDDAQVRLLDRMKKRADSVRGDA